MKRLSIVIAASFSLLSFTAFAGDNCFYGKDKNLAEAEIQDAVMAEKVDPALLALLKKQQAEKEQVKPIVTYN